MSENKEKARFATASWRNRFLRAHRFHLAITSRCPSRGSRSYPHIFRLGARSRCGTLDIQSVICLPADGESSVRIMVIEEKRVEMLKQSLTYCRLREPLDSCSHNVTKLCVHNRQCDSCCHLVCQLHLLQEKQNQTAQQFSIHKHRKHISTTL